MTPSHFQPDSDSIDAPRRALQFSTKELLSLVAIVAVACGIVRWLGPFAAAFLYVAVAPASARAFLVARREGTPHEMLGFCCIATSLTWFTLRLYTAALNADGESSTAWPVSHVLVPFLIGTVGANVGIIVGSLVLRMTSRGE